MGKKKKSARALTDKQSRFVDEYVVDNNATQAAVRSGYSPKTAYSMGQRLLKNAEIQNAIQKKQEKLQKRTEITAERVLTEEKTISFFDCRGIFNSDGELIPPKDLPEEVARAISGIDIIEKYDKDGNKTVTYKYRFNDKGRSLERVSRHLGLYNDSVAIKLDEGLKAIMTVLPSDIQEQVMTKLSEMNKKR